MARDSTRISPHFEWRALLGISLIYQSDRERGGGTGHNKAGTCKLVTLMKFTSQSDGIKNINVREGEEHFSNFHSYLSYKL